MAAFVSQREPDMDHFKYDQQMSRQIDSYGGGTSLPLNSDGYEDRQRVLRDERHQDFLQQQAKSPDHSYSVRHNHSNQLAHGPQHGGDYDHEIQKMTDRYHNKYDNVLFTADEQRRREKQMEETRRHTQSYPAQPKGPQMDYNVSQEQANMETRRGYQDYLKEKEAKELALRGRPVTPPGGLNIGQYDRQLKQDAAQKKKEYKQMLDKQQQEHMFLRARQEPEMSVFNRNNVGGPQHQQSQYLASKPPAGPSSRQRDEAFRTEPYTQTIPSGQPLYPGESQPPGQPQNDKPYERERRSPPPQRTPPNRARRSPPPLEPQRGYSPSRPDDQSSPRRIQKSLIAENDDYGIAGRRREAGIQRKQEYNEYLKNKAEDDRRKAEAHHTAGEPVKITTDPYYNSDSYEHHQSRLRNEEREKYREHLQKLNQDQSKSRRDWNFDQTGALELHGDDDVQSKKKELRAERIKDYNIYKHQMKAPPNHSWPAPDGRGALLVKKGEYEGVREMFREQRKQEFLKSLETQPQIENVMPLPRAVSEPAKVRPAYTNPMVESMGRYEEQQRRFVQDRRKDFRKFIDQLKPEDRYGRRNSESLPSIAGEEKPLVNNMGHYEMETKKKIREQRRKDFTDYNQIQKASPRNTVKENLMPHVASAETPLVDHMGHYTIENQMKLREERNRELRMFSEKKKQELRSPYDNYVFPMVAVAEKPVVDYLGLGLEQRKSELKEERKRDYMRYQTEQKQKELPRRHDYIDTAKGPYNGVFNGLGDYGKGKEILKRERKEEYNERLARDYAEHDRPSGRPNWAKETIPNNTDRGRSPMRNAGGGQQPGDDYSQRLDQKRVAERNMRRYNDPDPEYSGRHNEPEYQGRY